MGTEDLIKLISDLTGKFTLKKVLSASPYLLIVFFIFLFSWMFSTFLVSPAVGINTALNNFISFHKSLIEFFIAISLVYTIICFWNLAISKFWRARRYVLNTNKLAKDWEFQGILKDFGGKMLLAYSDSGCLIKGHQWSNFEMSFDFKLNIIKVGENDQRNIRGFGIIIRALDLENYIMLKLDDLISPHIRIAKFWEIISPKNCPLKIVDNKWHNCKLRVIDNIAELILDGKINYSYILPTHSSLSLDPRSREEDEPGIAGRITFRTTGTVGFRAWGYECPKTESLLIKDLMIRKIRG